MSKRFDEMVTRARAKPQYWAAKLAMDFAVDLYAIMQRKGITKAELASRIEASAPYVTKVLRGDANYSLETMAKLALAVGAKVEIRIVDEASGPFVQVIKQTAPSVGETSAYVGFNPAAANSAAAPVAA